MSLIEFLSDNKADILELSGIAGFGLSEICLTDASQKYYRDGDGKVYILPIVGSIASAGLVLMSGAEHHRKEAALSGAVALLTAENLRQRKVLQNKLSNEELYELDDKDKEKYALSDKATKNKELNEYWLKDFGLKINVEEWRIRSAEKDADDQFHDVGYVTLYDVLSYMDLESPVYDRFKVQSISYSLDPNDNYYSQGIRLVTYKGKTDDKIVNVLKIYRYCGDRLYSFD